MTLNRVRLFWKVAFWALVVLTTVMSLMPNEQVSSSLVFWDKAQHTLGFAALAVWAHLRGRSLFAGNSET